MNKLQFTLVTFLLLAHNAFSQKREPIIDVHIHAHQLWTSPDTAWYPKQLRRPSSNEELMRQTLHQMDKYNIVKAVASGEPETIQGWVNAAPNRFLPGYEPWPTLKPADVKNLRQLIQSGEVKVFAEIISQYAGISPSDSIMEPLYQLAEELDIPVGIHIGIAPPGAAVTGQYRSKLSSPLLLEEALIRHPKLRCYVMHAGWPMLDDMVAMLYAFPNLYVDIAVINWYIPKAEFYTYLKRLIEAGFSKRIMYGSDQMQWPQSIGPSIEAIESAPFLTKEQKRDIFYNNAATFFKLSDIK